MDHLLDKLHQLRSLREQLAQSDLAQGRQRLDQADQELSNKQALLEDHRLLQLKMEALLFKGIGRKKVSLNDFESYCGRISDLRTEEKNHQERVQQAERQKESACEEVDRLSVALHRRCREITKLEVFRKAWAFKVEEEKNQQLEEEMEEIVVNRFRHNDSVR
jgi:hypothetical protein